jgi:hypothetical protein
MTIAIYRAIATLGLAFACALSVQAQEAPKLTLDVPTPVQNIQTACTGIGSTSREDPRWAAYPLRIEAVGAGGQFLGDVQLSVTSGNQTLITVRCGGPWLLLRLPPGAYRVNGSFEGRAVQANANVPATGQGRVILRFPDAGGAVSPEYVPPGAR